MGKSIIFCSQVDLFLDNGGSYSNRAQLDAFMELGYKVTLIMPLTKTVVPECYKKNTEMLLVPERSLCQKYIGLLKCKVHRFSPFVEKWYEQIGQKRKYDFVYISGGLVAGDLAPFFQRKGIPVITLHNNIEFHYYMDDKNIITLWGTIPFFVKRKERRALLCSSLNLTVTERDLQTFKSLYKLPVSVNIAYWGCYEYKEKEKPIIEDKKHKSFYRILIMGTLKDAQTYLSMLYVKNVLKRFTAENISSVQVIIAGRKPPKSLYDEFGNVPGFEIVDTPEDMGRIISSADLLLNPVKMGSGLKLRNMDALRHGLPCIVHEVSANGYEKLEKYDFFKVYTTNEELYKYMVEMKEYKYNPNYIIDIYNRYFSFEAGVQNLDQLLTKMK